MNATGMLSIEEDVLNYIESSGDSVIYRVTPVYEGDNLLASGVIIEAAAVNGDYHLCRYAYNVQPGVEIDYRTGENHLASDASGVSSSDSSVSNSSNETSTSLTPEVVEPLDVSAYDFILNKKTLQKPARESSERRAESMSVIDMIAVISFGLTCFIAGYNIGKDKSKTQK